MLKNYYRLTKPGIIGANLMTAVAGFLFASVSPFDWIGFVGMAVGITFILASGTIANNFIDRSLDSKMERTKNRALVTGQIKPLHALLATILFGVIGLALLVLYTNLYTVLIGIFGFVSYVGIYGYAKRKSYLGTAIGTLPGASPMVAGYVAATNSIDRTSLALFLIMAIWQMAHFYAITIFRKDDYKSASIPVISIVKGVPKTKRHIVVYTAILVPCIVLLKAISSLGLISFFALLAISLWWLRITVSEIDHPKWAHKSFGGSLVVLIVISLILSMDGAIRL